jgi:hypothetical protein
LPSERNTTEVIAQRRIGRLQNDRALQRRRRRVISTHATDHTEQSTDLGITRRAERFEYPASLRELLCLNELPCSLLHECRGVIGISHCLNHHGGICYVVAFARLVHA